MNVIKQAERADGVKFRIVLETMNVPTHARLSDAATREAVDVVLATAADQCAALLAPTRPEGGRS